MYPKEVKAFIEWSKAMVAGATVERPKLKMAGEGGKMPRKQRRRRFRTRKRKRRRDGD